MNELKTIECVAAEAQWHFVQQASKQSANSAAPAGVMCVEIAAIYGLIERLAVEIRKAQAGPNGHA
jgi:hypothetical protein